VGLEDSTHPTKLETLGRNRSERKMCAEQTEQG
jgi:hypothetical protein